MAITPKEAAEKYFQEAVAQNVQQDFDKVVELYKKSLKLDPDHSGAQHNLRILQMVDLDKKAEAFMVSALSYEEGLQNKGIPNPAQAIKEYKEAKKHYQTLLNFFNDELRYIRDTEMLTPNTKLARYEKMLADNKQLADKSMAGLDNKILRNVFYMDGLKCEATIGSNGEPNYDGAIKEYKKAVALNHAPAKTIHDYLLKRNEKTKGAITRCEEAIALGHTNAMIDRAHRYEEGWGNEGIPQLDKAIDLYKRAYDHGNKRAKDEINTLAKKLYSVHENVVKMVCVERTAYDVKSYEDAIYKLCDALKMLSDLYKERWGNKGVAECKKAEDLDSAIRYLYDTLNMNRMNHIELAHLQERVEENPDAVSEPLQKKQKTTDSSKNTLTTAGMFSTVPALASPTKITTSGGYAIAGNRHITFSTPSTLSARKRPSILGGGRPLTVKRQKTEADMPRGMSASS